jgi:hypothetical protein
MCAGKVLRMSRFVTLISVSACLLASTGHLYADGLKRGRTLTTAGEPTGPCLELTQAQIDEIVSQGKRISLECRRHMKGRGCGKLGGPGYRSPNHRCVGYEELIKVCGEKPHTATGCVCEGVKVAPGCSQPTVSVEPVKPTKRARKLKRATGQPSEFDDPAKFEVPLKTRKR